MLPDPDEKTVATEKRRDLKRIIEIARPYRWLLLNISGIMLLASLLRLAMPLPIKFLIDSVFPNRDITLLFAVIIGLLLIHGFLQLLTYINMYTMGYVGNRVTFDLRRRLFRHLQRLSLSFYDKRRTGSILSRLMSDVAAIQQLITGQALTMVSNVFMFFAILVVLFVLDPTPYNHLAWVSLTVLPVHVIGMCYFNGRIKARSRRTREKMAQVHGNANEVLAGAKLVKSFTGESRESMSFVKDTREVFNLRLHQRELALRWNLLANVLHVSGQLIVIGFGGMAVLRTPELFTAGTFIAFYAYTNMLHGPLVQFVQMLNQILPALVGVERVYEILETRPEVEEAEDAVSVPRLKGDVEFEDVGFGYEGAEAPVLHNVTLSAAPGEVVALVGPSGSGKTTIANLVARFYDVTSGRVLIDGMDVRTLKLRPFRNQIGTVLQETFLFSTTVEENIRYGRPDATMDEVVEAARQANAHDFIAEMEEGYQTVVGENGALLSGGQRQRVAIARAILRDPRILILDEATSSLDTASEKVIQEALDRLMEGRTTFIIAHRLSTIRRANKVIVLDRGRIVQAGTHEELLRRDGLYRQLYAPEVEMAEEAAGLRIAKVA